MRDMDYAHCSECGQARPRRVLNDREVCPWCTLTVILTRQNPALRPLRKAQ